MFHYKLLYILFAQYVFIYTLYFSYIFSCCFILSNKLRKKRWVKMLFLDFPFLRYMYNNMYGGHWGDHRRRRFGDFRSQSFCQVAASGSRQGAFMECQTCYNLYGCCSLIFFRLKETFSNKAGWDVCWGSEGEVFVFVFVFFFNIYFCEEMMLLS